MNLATVPTWFWIGAAVVGYLYLSRKNATKTDASGPSPTVARPTALPAAQIVELRHVVGAPPASTGPSSADELTETRRVDFSFDVDVTPVPKTPATKKVEAAPP